jgi:TRAP-type uncharacterized transport system fused permease subunit
MAAIWLLSAGVVGYALHRLGTIERLAFALAGALLLLPATLFAGAIWFVLVGVVAATALVAREVGVWRKRRVAQEGAAAA